MARRRLKTGIPFSLELSDFRPQMSDEAKDNLFTHLLRCPDLLADALACLTPDKFDLAVESRYALILRGCKQLDEESGIGPLDKAFKRLLKVKIRSGVENDPDETLRDEADDLTGDDGLIDQAFEVDPDELSVEHARQTLSQLLTELTVDRPLNDLMQKCTLN